MAPDPRQTSEDFERKVKKERKKKLKETGGSRRMRERATESETNTGRQRGLESS